MKRSDFVVGSEPVDGLVSLGAITYADTKMNKLVTYIYEPIS